MLREETVERNLLELLNKIMRDTRLQDFYLVGGTALALTLGHRKSIDIDLFTKENFVAEELLQYLTNNYGFTLDKISDATVLGYIDNVKIDLIHYNYEMYKPLMEENGIRMASIEDIAAMKLTAIGLSGHRLKDFVDIAFLSTKLSLNDMLKSFEYKYPRTNTMIAIRGLSYFNDIDFSVKIDLINGKFNRKAIEERILAMIREPDKIFTKL